MKLQPEIRLCVTSVTEGKKRGETWNVTQEYWVSSGSHPDLGSIPNCAQTRHQPVPMREILEAMVLKACLFKACGNFMEFFWTCSGEKSYSTVGRLMGFFEHFWAGMAQKPQMFCTSVRQTSLPHCCRGGCSTPSTCFTSSWCFLKLDHERCSMPMSYH